MSASDQLAGAIAALRAGRPVQLGIGPVLLSVETGTEEMLRLLDPNGRAPLLISGERAAALGLANEALAADEGQPVLLSREPWLDAATGMTIVDPAYDLDRGPVGPLTPVRLADPVHAALALTLVRHAGLLPALWLLESVPDGSLRVSPEAIRATQPSARIVARAALPIDGIDHAQIVAFRDGATGREDVALVIGAFGGHPPLVRLHSECLTGDVFGSLKCDCGPQLREALRLIAAEGGGVLLYLRQEGRGIGLANKIRAYQLQDRGLDTVDANRRLGFADDTRDYAAAAAMLRALGISQVRLLTNNPAKVEGLVAEGVTVAERIAHHLPVNPHNADYVATKRARSGHLS